MARRSAIITLPAVPISCRKTAANRLRDSPPSNLSQSRIGLQGAEPLGVGDLKGVFRLETFFNPQSGQISDAEKSMVLNNGKAAGAQTTNLDSSVAGQAFQTVYGGISSKMYGAVTFGRQTGLVADGISKYDPNYASQAFSLIGMSGTYAGAGDTEDRRFDNSIKYSVTAMDIVRFGRSTNLTTPAVPAILRGRRTLAPTT